MIDRDLFDRVLAMLPNGGANLTHVAKLRIARLCGEIVTIATTPAGGPFVPADELFTGLLASCENPHLPTGYYESLKHYPAERLAVVTDAPDTPHVVEDR